MFLLFFVHIFSYIFLFNHLKNKKLTKEKKILTLSQPNTLTILFRLPGADDVHTVAVFAGNAARTQDTAKSAGAI